MAFCVRTYDKNYPLFWYQVSLNVKYKHFGKVLTEYTACENINSGLLYLEFFFIWLHTQRQCESLYKTVKVHLFKKFLRSALVESTPHVSSLMLTAETQDFH